MLFVHGVTQLSMIFLKVGEIDVDSISDSDDSKQENNDQEEESDYTHFKKLHEFLHNEEISKIIDVPVKGTAGELSLMLIKYALICSISFSAVASLFLHINSIFARPILSAVQIFN